MKVKTDPGPLFAHATEAFYAAAEDVLQDAANTAPWRTGRYSKSMKVWRRNRSSGPTARVGSTLPYAGPLERGAWVRHGRGVHIARANAPGTLRQAGERFPEHYTRRLGSTPIRSSAFVSGSAGRELGLAGLDLSGEA
jgi:hypothetical protein